METFSAREIARLSGFKTALMLNYLERSGTFERQLGGPIHHGKHRQYTFRDLVVLRAINRLLEIGARPKRIAEAISTFARIQNLPSNSDALAEFARSSSLFVVTTDRVIFCQPEELVELTKGGQLTFSFMVDNRSIFAPVADAAIRYIMAVKGNRPRNSATLEKIAKSAGL